MNLYKISVAGCDDSTIIHMELTKEEAAVVKRVAETVTDASSYSCMPIMEITKETKK